jgi:ABC-type antimicrobial peptide transport system permease subunit
MESLRQDFRYTCRGLRRHPGFCLAAVLSLALGMGVNTAIFSATDALLWKPLPVRHPDRTVYVFHSSPTNSDVGTSFRAFEAYRQRRRIEDEVRTLAPAWPAFGFRRLDEGLHLQRLIPRTGATVLGTLGAFALLLSAVGIYGVTSYVVAARMREMGIRLALGSPAGAVTALVVKQVMRVCVPGAAVGTSLALATARVMDAVLVATSSADLATFVMVPLALLGVAAVASYLPARHAARTNPLIVLRAE